MIALPFMLRLNKKQVSVTLTCGLLTSCALSFSSANTYKTLIILRLTCALLASCALLLSSANTLDSAGGPCWQRFCTCCCACTTLQGAVVYRVRMGWIYGVTCRIDALVDNDKVRWREASTSHDCARFWSNRTEVCAGNCGRAAARQGFEKLEGKKMYVPRGAAG